MSSISETIRDHKVSAGLVVASEAATIGMVLKSAIEGKPMSPQESLTLLGLMAFCGGLPAGIVAAAVEHLKKLSQENMEGANNLTPLPPSPQNHTAA